MVEDFRGRTLRLFGLPLEESCEISVVNDKPWMAYNWYLGKGRSRIVFNQDFPMEIWGIPTAVAHETYPGHHTESAIKEHKLYIGEGRLEHSILLSNNPSSLISEGIAANALLAVASEAEIAATLVDCYARAGLPESDAGRALAFIEAFRQLKSVSDNQLLLLTSRSRARGLKSLTTEFANALSKGGRGPLLFASTRTPLAVLRLQLHTG